VQLQDSAWSFSSETRKKLIIMHSMAQNLRGKNLRLKSDQKGFRGGEEKDCDQAKIRRSHDSLRQNEKKVSEEGSQRAQTQQKGMIKREKSSETGKRGGVRGRKGVLFVKETKIGNPFDEGIEDSRDKKLSR